MMWCAVATVTFVASNMMLLIVHVKMIAAPLVLRLQTAVFSLRFATMIPSLKQPQQHVIRTALAPCKWY